MSVRPVATPVASPRPSNEAVTYACRLKASQIAMPPLSKLSIQTEQQDIATKRKSESSGGGGNRPASFDGDWKAYLINNLNSEGDTVTFKVVNGAQEMTFHVKATQVQARVLQKAQMYNSVAGSNSTCALIELDFESGEMYINDLFLDNAKGCEMRPERSKFQGAGDVVLRLCAQMVSSLKLNMWLFDLANFQDDADYPAFHPSNKLTRTLRIQRGFGYYEKRGFFAKALYEHVNAENDLNTLVSLALYQTFQLSWTHMLATTPLKDLDLKMHDFASFSFKKAFPTLTSSLLQTTSPELGQGGLDLVRKYDDFFSPEELDSTDAEWKTKNKDRFKKANLLLVDLMQLIGSMDPLLAMLGCAPSSSTLSLRQISKLVNSPSSLFSYDFVSDLNEKVSDLLEILEDFNPENTNTARLEKRVYNIDNTPYVITVDTNPKDQDAQPVLVLRPLDDPDQVKLKVHKRVKAARPS